MNNLFASAPTTGRLSIPLLPQCGSCGLYQHCQSPKMPVTGSGKRGILILAEAPGAEEDKQNKQFMGSSGQFLRGILRDLGTNPDEDFWWDNSLMCRPTKTVNGKVNNRTPTDKEVAYCRPHVVENIKRLKPRMIITLGAIPIDSLMGWLWGRSTGALSRWVGWQIPVQQINAWICPTWHPSWITRPDESGVKSGVRELLFRKHLKAALEVEGYPDWVEWQGASGFDGQIELIFEPDKAAEAIGTIYNSGGVVFDLECDGLKPDSKNLDIICASMSDGTKTIAFPWCGKAVEAFTHFLLSDIPKIGWNVKFEHRWLKAKLGVTVRNWIHDGMITAHILNNWSGLTGLEFQSWVNLGVRPWDQEVESYMSSKSPKEPNRLRQVDLKQLLKYCAYDSLFEWLISKKQMVELHKRSKK